MIRTPPKSTLFPYTPLFLFFFNDTATTEIYTLSLHDALPISARRPRHRRAACICGSGRADESEERRRGRIAPCPSPPPALAGCAGAAVPLGSSQAGPRRCEEPQIGRAHV